MLQLQHYQNNRTGSGNCSAVMHLTTITTIYSIAKYYNQIKNKKVYTTITITTTT